MPAENIDLKTVKYVAALSRIELSEKQLGLYRRQLARILGYIAKLNEIDTGKVLPTSHPLANIRNVFRPDTVKPSLDVGDALKNAPRRKGDFFSVPKILG